MNRSLPHRICCVAALMVLFAAAAGVNAGTTLSDRVYRTGSDDPIVQEVVSDTITGVKLRNGLEIPLEGLDRVEYADAPFSYREAEKHRELARFDEAILKYEGALKSPTTRKFWLEQHCRYYIGLCYLESGQLDKAQKAFADLLRSDPDTRFLPEAMLAQGRVEFARKNYAGAVAKFEKLAGKGWTEWKHRANLWKAKALLEQKKYSSALSVVESLITGIGQEKYTDILVEAKTIEALVYVRMGKFDDGVKKLNDLIDEIAPAVARERQGGAETKMQRIEAQCKNALGRCYLKKAEKSNRKDDYKAARLSFLWTIVLYPNFQEERAEALYYGVKALEKLDDTKRAAALKAELDEQFPDAKFED